MFVILLPVFIFTMLKSSGEPIYISLLDTWASEYLQQWKTGNTIIFSISTGYVVSFIFWVMNISLPTYLRKREHKQILVKNYKNYRKDLIHIILGAHANCRRKYSSGCDLDDLWGDRELEDKLLDPSNFKDFFRKDRHKNWYGVLNGLDEPYISDLYTEFELFEKKMDSYIANYGSGRKKAREYYAWYTDFTHRLKNASVYSDDQAKYIGNYLWEIMGQCSSIHGDLKEDTIMRIINSV